MPEDDMFAAEEMADPEPGMFDEPAPADSIALGAADEAELDDLFAADAQALFPDFDDAQLTSLQKLIDSRIEQLYGTPEPDMATMEPEPSLGEGDLGL